MPVRRFVAVAILALIARGSASAQDLPVPRGTPPTPGVAGRPLAWPGNQPSQAMQPLEMTVVVARVGPEVILAGDVCAQVREMLAANVDRIPVGQADAAAAIFLKQAISGASDRKLLYLEAARNFQEEEHKKKVFGQIDEDFEKTELKRLMKRAGAAHRGELEGILAERGTTMEREKQIYREKVLASHVVQEASKREEEITHDDMLEYYHSHSEEFDREAKAHWLQLFVRRGDKPALDCRNRIAWMGNQIQAGQPWAQIAKQHSDDASAVEGGDRGWTTLGSLKSKKIEEALFSLPIGTMSPIIEDETGWHILRVVERQDAGRVPFEDAQKDIQEKIAENRRRERLQKFIEDIRKNTKVWTIFEDTPEADRLVGYLSAPVAEYLRRTAQRNPSALLDSPTQQQ